MAAAVLQPLQGLSLNGGIMDPSPISPNASRHGRGKHGGSVAKSKRGRGYSVVDDRETLISKALIFALKRTVEEGEEGEDEKLVADSEGWVDVEDVLARPNVSALEVSLAELQSLVLTPKSRFSLKHSSDSKDTAPEDLDASDYIIRLNPSVPQTPVAATSAILTPLTLATPDLPELIVYECSYASYPLILASGGIKRAGGQAYLTFSAIKIDEEDRPDEMRSSSAAANNSKADVSISLSLRSILEAEPKISWARSETGAVVTEGDAQGVIVKQHWVKAVARRADIGTLFENGEVRKEVPIGLRGKNVKVKKGKNGGVVKKEMKARSEDDSASDE